MVATVVEAAAGHVPIVAGVREQRHAPHGGCRQARGGGGRAGAARGHALLQQAQPQRACCAHYRAVCEAAGLPVVVYNVPGRTGQNLGVELTLALARDPRGRRRQGGLRQSGADRGHPRGTARGLLRSLGRRCAGPARHGPGSGRPRLGRVQRGARGDRGADPLLPGRRVRPRARAPLPPASPDARQLRGEQPRAREDGARAAGALPGRPARRRWVRPSRAHAPRCARRWSAPAWSGWARDA